MQKESEYTWRITQTRQEAPDVVSLYLQSQGERPTFKAGQYLTIKIPELGPTEGKAYSISSAPQEEIIRITIRKIGLFSKSLTELDTGNTLTTSSPYGYFYPEPDDTTDLVFVVGGIGITPCLSIIKDLGAIESQRNIHLFYSNRTVEDTAFSNELRTQSENNPLFKCHHFITREKSKYNGFHQGRITTNKIFELLPKPLVSEFFICGAMDFTKSLWKDLRETGVPQHQLYTEGFF